MAIPNARWLYLAGVEDIPALTGLVDDWHHEWPPPHTDITYDPLGELTDGAYEVGRLQTSARTFFRAGGAPGFDLPPGVWWTTLSDVWTSLSPGGPLALARVVRYLDDNPVLKALFSPLSLPVIYHWERGEHMRWIRNTIRGLLNGGEEEFQFKMDWGNPGDDPTITPAEAGAFAELSFESLVKNFTGAGAHPVATLFTSDVAFTESGVALLTSTDATDSDGKNGNLTYEFPTEWYMTPSITTYKGSSVDYMPFEVATAVTLLTSVRGPRGRGRCFLPPLGGNWVVAGGLWAVGAAALAGHFIGDWIDEVKANSEYVPLVVSRRALQLHEVTSIEVGQVPDSQRRRRRSQVEARVPYWTA